jgi:DNA-binding LytR/AlgR family response regulator
VGGTKLFLSAFFPHSWYPDIFLDLLPVRILIDALIYAIVVMSYYLLQSVQEIDKQSDVLAETLHTQSMPEEIWTRITVKKHKKIHLIPVKDILYVEANGDYVLIYTASGHFLKDSTMKYMETHLPPDLFVRIHRSFIINIECMTKLELYEKDLYQLHLQDNTILKVSSAGYKLLKQKLK